jgi:hypothetical protein
MRFRLSLGLYLASALMAYSQDLREVPETEAVPASVAASIEASTSPDEFQTGLRRWEGNMVGDATPDYLVEAWFSPVGGNAFYPRHYIFIANPDGFDAFFPIQLPGSIIAVAIEANALVFTLSTYLPSDARCCPSGVETLRMPLT